MFPSTGSAGSVALVFFQTWSSCCEVEGPECLHSSDSWLAVQPWLDPDGTPLHRSLSQHALCLLSSYWSTRFHWVIIEKSWEILTFPSCSSRKVFVLCDSVCFPQVVCFFPRFSHLALRLVWRAKCLREAVCFAKRSKYQGEQLLKALKGQRTMKWFHFLFYLLHLCSVCFYYLFEKKCHLQRTLRRKVCSRSKCLHHWSWNVTWSSHF